MLRAIAAAKKKNDKIDAGKIADCLRCDFLPECRIGSNYNELPVNRPKVEVQSYAEDGHLRHFYNGARTPVYAPNSFGGPKADPVRAAKPGGWSSDGELVRSAYTLRADDDDFGQAGKLVREVFDDAQRGRLVETVVGQYNALKYEHVRERFLWYWH
jgi:catalase